MFVFLYLKSAILHNSSWWLCHKKSQIGFSIVVRSTARTIRWQKGTELQRKTSEVFPKMSEIFWKTWEFFGKLSEIFFRTWEIFSHKWESPKNRPQRNGFSKPLARVTRARITGIFIFSLSQPSHERWFLPRNRLKMFPKRKRLHKKTHPLFCWEMVKVVKAKKQKS